jgi:starch synthase
LRARGDVDVRVRCFGAPRDEDGTTAYPDLTELAGANAALQTLGVDLAIAQDCEGADLVHSHTWYANMGGHLAWPAGDAPHVVTAHSLEPMRPWKAEQLGGGYRVSSWVEKTAYEAADARDRGERRDARGHPALLPLARPGQGAVVHNGIDSQLWQPPSTTTTSAATASTPTGRAVIFVGRITRQKGLPYLLRAAAELPPEVQVVLCAGAPDTPRSWPRSRASSPTCAPRGTGSSGSRDAAAQRGHRDAHRRHGLRLPVGLRAARHRQPRGDGLRAAGRRHGDRRHPRGRRHGETGWLVPIEQVQDGTGTPVDPDRFVADLAAAPSPTP